MQSFALYKALEKISYLMLGHPHFAIHRSNLYSCGTYRYTSCFHYPVILNVNALLVDNSFSTPSMSFMIELSSTRA